jgi:hypothetical protein
MMVLPGVGAWPRGKCHRDRHRWGESLNALEELFLLGELAGTSNNSPEVEAAGSRDRAFAAALRQPGSEDSKRAWRIGPDTPRQRIGAGMSKPGPRLEGRQQREPSVEVPRPLDPRVASSRSSSWNHWRPGSRTWWTASCNPQRMHRKTWVGSAAAPSWPLLGCCSGTNLAASQPLLLALSNDMLVSSCLEIQYAGGSYIAVETEATFLTWEILGPPAQ